MVLMDNFVFHKTFGLGLVLDYSGNFTKVLFLNYGTKSIVNSFLQTIPSNLINDVINFKFNNNYNFKEKLMTEYENTVFSCFNDDEIYSVDLTYLEDNYALFHLQIQTVRTRAQAKKTVLRHTLPGLQKGGVPAAPSGTATLLRLSPSHRFYPRPILAVTDFRHPRLPWLDGRCVQGPGTYSPRHG